MKLKTFLTIALTVSVCLAHAQQIYAGKYKAVFTSPPKKTPTNKTPDAPLAGNGDIGLTLGGKPDALRLFFGKNDFWRAYPVYPGGGIALPGGLNISIDALKNGSFYAEQIMDKALIKAIFSKDKFKLELKTWVTAMHNTVVVELTANQSCRVNLDLWSATGNTSVNEEGYSGNVNWVTRSFENTPLLEWPAHVAMAMIIIGSTSIKDQPIILLPNKKTTVAITIYSNFDRKEWKNAAILDAGAITNKVIEEMRKAHEQWWKQFWSKSTIRINDEYLEKYYFASQYLFASTSRKNKFAPGIWGCFITQDSTAWGGDYHLNYNYQSPYWAAYSSNHIELTENFDQPVLDYMEKGKVHAQSLLGIRGIYYPVGIGPKALVTTRWPLTPDEMERRYATRENNIDSGFKFLGQKINAVFSVGNMLMRFYSTYDREYAERIYSYMIECANFWEDYLKFEEGRYVIYMDHFNEIMPNLNNKGIWRDRLGDFNSTLSLGLVKMLFKGMLEISRFLGKDQERQEKWQHIHEHLSKYPLGEIDGRWSLKNMEKGPPGREVRISGLNRVSIHGLILPGGVAGPKTDPELNKILLGDIERWRNRMQREGEWGNTLGNGIETNFPAAVRVGYKGDSIIKYLKDRIALTALPNLWITQEGGGIETLAAVPLTVNEMLMQSYEGVVRIFPNWNHERDASFQTLRAYGAFLVSSELKNGKIIYVNLFSEKGRNCLLENPWPGKKILVTRNGKPSETLSGDTIEFKTGAGETLKLIEAK